MRNQSNFISRIGVRAVVAGTLLTISLTFLLMTLVAAMGFWNFRINDIPNMSSGYWFMAMLAWAISSFAGGFVASIASRSESNADGILNGVTAISASYVAIGVGAIIFAPYALESTLAAATPQMFLQSFVGDAMGFVFGALGGLTGVSYERRLVFISRRRGALA